MDTNTITFSFKFNRLNRPLNKDGKGPVTLIAYKPKSRTRKYISTGIYIHPEQWHIKDSLIINHDLANDFNWKLSDLKTSYQKKVLDLTRRNGKCSLGDLDLNYKSGYQSFIDFFEDEIKLSIKSKAYGTIQTYRSALAKLRDYRARIFFEDLDYRFIQGFDAYMHGLKFKSTVTAKYHKIVKYMINQAIRKDLFDKNPYFKFKIKTGVPEPRVFLSQEEISRLEAHN